MSLPEEASAGWWAAAQEDIRRSEYQVTWQDRTSLADLPAAFQAPNRAHNLRTYFTARGIRVVPRSGDSPAWQWGLTLVGYGYAGRAQTPRAAQLASNGNRIEYRRGDLVEWYVNDERGLEQGFTLSAPPSSGRAAGFSLRGAPTPDDALEPPSTARAEARGSLHIDLRVTGELTGTLGDDGQAIEFTTRHGVRVLSYAELKVVDATSRELPARFALAGERLSILVDDSGAVYPVTIDPLATSPSWTAEGDQAGAAFSRSAATAGDVNRDGYGDVIVGAPFYDVGTNGNAGRAFVYHGSASGLSATPDWTVEGDEALGLFGYSVSTAGDVNGDGYSDVMVSAPGSSADEAVFVYHGSASGLSTSADWTALGEQADSNFGYSVSTAGDVNGDGFSDVVVGADFYGTGLMEAQGAAYVFHGSAAGLSNTPNWTAVGESVGDWFGHPASTAGDVNGDGYSDVIVGAPAYESDLLEADEGRVYVYHGSAAGLSGAADWTAESDQLSAYLGNSVATAGDVNGDGYSDVIVGAYNYDAPEMNEGRAFVWHGSASGLGTNGIPGNADWTADGDQDNAWFSFWVSAAGDVNGDGYADVIVGGFRYDNGQTDEGAAFVWHGSSSGLGPDGTPANADWTAESDQADARFGRCVATAGDVNGDGFSDVIIGAPFYDNPLADEGRAYVYHGAPAGLSATAGWTDQGQVDASFGWSVASAGDVNGDGYADVIVGAEVYDGGQTDEGQAYVYHGSATGLSAAPDWTVESNQADAGLGHSVASAGDVNGDGYSDVIVGAWGYDNGPLDWAGRAFVYHGSATGLGPTTVWTADGDVAWGAFGSSVATAGDVNGDGYADVVVGAEEYTNDLEREGRAFAYQGSGTGLSLTADWTAEGDQFEAFFGSSVATAGDVNGDGYADIIVGAYSFGAESSPRGRSYVYHGAPAGLDPAPNWTVDGDPGDMLGKSASTAGDVNGDGYSDVIVGAPSRELSKGWAFVYHGSNAGLSATPNWSAQGNLTGESFGSSVATAGDVNGDGYSDVVVGAWGYDNGQTSEGRAFVFRGSPAGLSVTADWTAESDEDWAFFGLSVATAGDVNGDGYADVIVGAPGYWNGGTGVGQAFVYYGNDGGGLTLRRQRSMSGPGAAPRPRQRRSNDSAPIAHLGSSDSPDSFRLAALGRTPFGRGLVKLEWEVKPLGTVFDGLGTQRSVAFVDTGTSGVELTELATRLTACGTPYHWRLRLLYDPVTSPSQQHSRWLTVPYSGWQEMKLRTASVWGDSDCDGDVSLNDYADFFNCLTGPDHPPVTQGCEVFDVELDDDVDLTDFAAFQEALPGS